METRRFRFRRARTLLTARARTGSQRAGAAATAEDADSTYYLVLPLRPFWGTASRQTGSSRAGGVDYSPELT